MNVLITGSSRGLGLEFVRQFLERGEHVFASCRNPLHSMGLRRLKEAHPHDLTILPLDVADAGSLRRCRELVSEKTRSLDLLVNSAGLFSPQSDVPLARENADLLQAGTNPKAVSLGKAATSADLRSLAAEFKSRGIAVIVLDPGPAPDPEHSVRGMINEIERLSLEKTGRFVQHKHIDK